LRWLESVEEGLKNTGRTIWRNKPQHREYWGPILEEGQPRTVRPEEDKEA